MCAPARLVLGAATILALALATSPGCSQGQGEGRITGTLAVGGCWSGAFELAPDFFAGQPFGKTFQIKIQSGSDFQTFSDGLTISLYDTTTIRPDPATGEAGRYGQPLRVSLPPEVTPPGVPVRPDPDPAPASLTLYLQRSCRVQNVTLHAVSEVTLAPDGTCDAPALLGGDPTQGCAADKESPAGIGNGRSLIAFKSVANGRLDEPTASERLTAGCFDVYLADPRDVAAGGVGPPPRCRGHLKGTFSFFFERGRPAQAFP
jgi:hypothetical protein